MKIKDAQLGKLAHLIANHLDGQRLVKIKSSKQAVIGKIEEILLANAREEDAIVEQTRKMLEAHRDKIASGEVDYQKMFNMIKKQIMKDKDFIP